MAVTMSEQKRPYYDPSVLRKKRNELFAEFKRSIGFGKTLIIDTKGNVIEYTRGGYEPKR